MKNVYRMLFELATGNLAYRIEPTPSNDEIEKLSSVLNTLGLTLQNTIAKSGYVIPYYNYQSVIQNTFLLGIDFNIKSFNASVISNLSYSPDELNKMVFDEMIAPQSADVWQSIKQEILKDVEYHSTIQLVLITGNKKLLPLHFTISKLLMSNEILITSLTTVLQDSLGDTFNSNNKPTSPTKDSAIIQNVYDYILNNLEEPLPPLKVLARRFGSNEFKLKEGFRHFFNTSIYQLYNNERLKKAHNLILQTDISLKEISFLCGFNSYLNFYKAFKKKYRYAPSELSRKTTL
ncbi:helix-turn-helix transcriptional regulator [Flavobacterium sedimenticola]|uniref:AraC family transcriptional regulator n=1 Tax=Flavobacterium sedimenticola TaxID=3043286 RepID=A0ABT6XSG5_9FLAO|nr:AraC family transcriptional regulator [Flavobacterium sedimenticola]MDI9257958.1 AraC family transcriptional regulator [Flavobacterium sedimenticola]